LGALIIGGESLTRSLFSSLRKTLSEVTPGLQQLNREAHPRLPFAVVRRDADLSAKFRSFAFYADAGNVIKAHEHASVFKEP
jgi:hypothetical protein